MQDTLDILLLGISEPDDYIEHHGVLGMKWGKRKHQNKEASLNLKDKSKYRKTEKIEPNDIIKLKKPNDVSLDILLKKSKIKKERLLDRIDEILDEKPNISIKEIVDDARFADSLISWVKAKEEYAEQYTKHQRR